MVKKKYQKKIEERFKDIFNTENQNKENQYSGLNGIITVVKEPIVKHQIIQLAKLCEEVPNNMALKSSGGAVHIEFW
ncbi:MAG: hypothetical protein ABJK28_04170 [Algibacter sp.]